MAPECKLLSRPAWSHFLSAVEQAERNAEGLIPCAVVKRNGARDADTLLVMRLSTFIEHFASERHQTETE